MITHQLRIVAWCLGTCFVMASVGARAGGLFYPDIGTVALGRGTAFAARADNLSAFYYNPAGLSKSKGFNVLLGGNLNDLNVTFKRQGAKEAGSGLNKEWFPLNDSYYIDPSADPPIYLGVGNPQMDYSGGIENPREFLPVTQETPLIVNAVTVIANWGDAFRVEGLSIALGAFAPSGYTKHKYPDNAPGRYAVQELNSLIIYPGVGLSYAVNRYFQIGAVFLSGMAFIDKKQASRLSPTSEDIHFNEDKSGDATITLDMQDYFMPSGIVGVLSRPLDWLELGISVRLPVFMNAKGNVEYQAPEGDYPEAVVEAGHHSVVVEHHFPWVVTTGVRYIHKLFDIEVDFVWENWNSYDGMDVNMDLHIDLDDLKETPPKVIPDTHIPKNFRDTYSVRVGSDIEVWPDNITIRLGGLYQSSAYPENNDTFSLDFPFGEQYGASFGLTWHAFGYVDASIGYLHIFQPRVTVEEGILQQSSGTLADVYTDGSVLLALGNTVNNGTYDVDLNIFAMSLEGHF